MRNKVLLLLFCAFLLSSQIILSQIRLPRLISNGMVLQRGVKIKIWGWASNGEKVSVRFLNSIYTTKANNNGEWSILLPKIKTGGPYNMTITGNDTISLNNIYIGDVWVCSGQSNMELSMERVRPLYEEDIADCQNEQIRCFTVPQKYDFNKECNDYQSGEWKATSPNSILKFSAVAYFFARELNKKYHIPIGIINASLGGSPAEAWISETSLKEFPIYFNEIQRYKDSSLIIRTENHDRTVSQAWYNQLAIRDKGYKNPTQTWRDPNLNTADWDTMSIPGYWANTKMGAINGIVWFRKDFDLTAEAVGQVAKLNIGRIVDADSVFVNGIFVGTTSYQYPPRRYIIPSGILKEGKNSIVVKVISNSGLGGFVLDKPYELIVSQNKIDLKGEWRYKLGATMNPLPGQTFICWKPAGLYNAMIAPLLNYSIKGVAWYQGESNAGKPYEYQHLLSTLIKTWRDSWHQGNFPFLVVQLPNYMEAVKQPSESNWARMREAQLKILQNPNTGLAVTIDLGEWNDIHPLNKRDVGKRLALAAQKIAYNDRSSETSGPIYRSMKIDNNKIILFFRNVGKGLEAKENTELRQFSIAGIDKHFVWAKAKIENDRIIVWSEEISSPVAVRYAWADNPQGANLYNIDGLPASPFRTDDW